MRRIYIFSLLFILTCTVSAQVGDTFPEMEAESLSKTFVNIPEEIKGKYTLIGLAFSKKSEQDLKTWFNPVFNTFLDKKENPGFFDVSYDVYGYFIPMFSGAKRAAYGKVMKKMKEGIDPKLQPHVLFYKGTINNYKKALNFQGKDVPYFYILDPDSKIVYTTSGKYSDGKMQQIVDAVQDAMDIN
jgi:hypothetical protein